MYHIYRVKKNNFELFKESLASGETGDEAWISFGASNNYSRFKDTTRFECFYVPEDYNKQPGPDKYDILKAAKTLIVRNVFGNVDTSKVAESCDKIDLELFVMMMLKDYSPYRMHTMARATASFRTRLNNYDRFIVETEKRFLKLGLTQDFINKSLKGLKIDAD